MRNSYQQRLIQRYEDLYDQQELYAQPTAVTPVKQEIDIELVSTYSEEVRVNLCSDVSSCDLGFAESVVTPKGNNNIFNIGSRANSQGSHGSMFDLEDLVEEIQGEEECEHPPSIAYV